MFFYPFKVTQTPDTRAYFRYGIQMRTCPRKSYLFSRVLSFAVATICKQVFTLIHSLKYFSEGICGFHQHK